MDDLGTYIGTLTRSFVIGWGTWAVATGYFTADGWGTIAAASGVLAMAAWGVAQKYFAKKKLEEVKAGAA